MRGYQTSCSAVGRHVSDFIDGRLEEQDWQQVREHLESCPGCSQWAQQVLQLRASLRAMPGRNVPAELAVRLRVLASREHLYRSRRATFASMLRYLNDRVSLFFLNLMRPLALPFAGGLVSTLVLFGAIFPSFAPNRTPGVDTPINDALFTEATVRNSLPVGFSEENVTVDVLIDENGRMLEYSLPDGQRIHDPQLLRNLENTLLFTVYRPATLFGQPTAGRVRLTFRRTAMDVKG